MYSINAIVSCDVVSCGYILCLDMFRVYPCVDMVSCGYILCLDMLRVFPCDEVSCGYILCLDMFRVYLSLLVVMWCPVDIYCALFTVYLSLLVVMWCPLDIYCAHVLSVSMNASCDVWCP